MKPPGPRSDIAPTVSAAGAAPGVPTVQVPGPALPAATATTIPAATARGDRLRGQVGAVVAAVGAEREVRGLDPVDALVGDDPVERRDDVRERAAAGGVQHLEADEAGRRRDALVEVVGAAVAVAGDRAGDVACRGRCRRTASCGR